jgi:hypothetical protein
MNQDRSDPPPDAGHVLKFVASRAWRSKWLIAGAAIVAAAIVFLLYRPSSAVQVWTASTTLTIGVAPPTDFVMQKAGPSIAPLEDQRTAIARISSPTFKADLLRRANLAPETAAASKSLIYSTLRGSKREGDRDVEIEVSAASAADVRAALAALAAEINKAHGDILKRRAQPLLDRIEEAKARLAQIEKWNDGLSTQIFAADVADGTPHSSALIPALARLITTWSDLKDRIQGDTGLATLVEPSIVRLDPDTISSSSRTVSTLRASIVAGLVMLAAMVVLSLVIRSPERS